MKKNILSWLFSCVKLQCSALWTVIWDYCRLSITRYSRKGEEAKQPVVLLKGPVPGRSGSEQPQPSTAKFCVAKARHICPGLSMAVICFISKGGCCPCSWARVWLPCGIRAFLGDPNQIGGMSGQAQDPSQGQCYQSAASRIAFVTHVRDKTDM